MSESDSPKRKVVHKAEDFIALEDELTEVCTENRLLRQDLAKYGMDGVELQSGTFRMYLAKMRGCVPALRSALEKQAIEKHARDTRERIRKGMK